MKKKLLVLITSFALCLPMFAAFYMCVKLTNSDTFKFEVEKIKEVTQKKSDSTTSDSYMSIKQTTGDVVKYAVKEISEVYYEKIPVDTTAIDADSVPLFFCILTDSTVEVSGYNKNYFIDEDGMIVEKEIVIPSNVYIDNVKYTITNVGEKAFAQCSGLTSINIPSTVIYIGEDAFSNCKGLKSIELSEGLLSIGEEAFQYCTGLTNILIPSTVTNISGWAFYSCTYINIEIDNSKDNVKVGDNAFGACKSVKYLKGDYAAVDATKTGLTFKILTDSTAEVSKVNSTSVDTVIVPAKIQLNGKAYTVTSIGEKAFATTSDNSGLKSFSLPATITNIGAEAFTWTNIKTINIPSNVTTIGEKAFSFCLGLTSIDIPSAATTIESNAFYGSTNLTNINVEANNTNYSSVDGVLYNAKETEIICHPAGIKENFIIPTNITSISSYAFYGCANLTEITIPSEVVRIGEYAFAGCTNLDVKVDNYKDSIEVGANAFDECKSVTYNSIDTIPSDSATVEEVLKFRILSDSTAEVVSGCADTISIPDTVLIGEKVYTITSIGHGAFAECDSLASIKISENVTYIGGSAFAGCSKLADVEIPSVITAIGDSLFMGCSNLASITISENVKNIGAKAFMGCENLEIVIDNYQDSITVGDGAFEGCKNITYTKIDPTIVDASKTPVKFKILTDSTVEVTKCDANKIYGTVTIPLKVRIDGKVYLVNRIGDNAFAKCVAMTSIEIPDTITSIGNNAFDGCNALTKITLPANLTTIGEEAFIDCGNMMSITIPSSVTSLGRQAFAYCSRLNAVVENKEENIEIGDFAFYDCKSVKYAE